MPEKTENIESLSAEASQRVVLFGGPDTGLQEAYYKADEDWVSVLHDGQEMNMRRENWEKLVTLVNSVLPK